jgi:hypothetical protein
MRKIWAINSREALPTKVPRNSQQNMVSILFPLSAAFSHLSDELKWNHVPALHHYRLAAVMPMVHTFDS